MQSEFTSASPEEMELELQQLLQAPVSVPGQPSAFIAGHLEGIDDEGRLLFRPEGAELPRVPVTIGMSASDVVLLKAAQSFQRALVAQTAAAEFVLIGLLRERISTSAAKKGELEVRMDGETVQLSAEHQIELKCGKSSLILRRSGRVILKGTYVVTTSSGPVKIKGATVALN